MLAIKTHAVLLIDKATSKVIGACYSARPRIIDTTNGRCTQAVLDWADGENTEQAESRLTQKLHVRGVAMWFGTLPKAPCG